MSKQACCEYLCVDLQLGLSVSAARWDCYVIGDTHGNGQCYASFFCIVMLCTCTLESLFLFFHHQCGEKVALFFFFVVQNCIRPQMRLHVNVGVGVGGAGRGKGGKGREEGELRRVRACIQGCCIYHRASQPFSDRDPYFKDTFPSPKAFPNPLAQMWTRRGRKNLSSTVLSPS